MLEIKDDLVTDENNILFSVVCPIYNESDNLISFIDELIMTVKSIGVSYEIILVDDGSYDNSWKIIESAHKLNHNIKGISFSRNFGHQHAIIAGLRKARGRAVGVMDGDGQDPPEVLKRLFLKWQDGYDVVYAIREKRRGGILKNFCYFSFYRIIKILVPFNMPVDSGDFSVMSREVVDFLIQQREQNPYLRGLRSWWGGRQVGIPYERPHRTKGKTKYSFFKLLLLGVYGITSFSRVPLRIFAIIGFAISLGSTIYGLYNIFLKLTYGLPIGYSSIIVAITFLGGLIIFMLGIIGEYIGNIFEDGRNMPQYIIKKEVR